MSKVHSNYIAVIAPTKISYDIYTDFRVGQYKRITSLDDVRGRKFEKLVIIDRQDCKKNFKPGELNEIFNYMDRHKIEIELVLQRGSSI